MNTFICTLNREFFHSDLVILYPSVTQFNLKNFVLAHHPPRSFIKWKQPLCFVFFFFFFSGQAEGYTKKVDPKSSRM